MDLDAAATRDITAAMNGNLAAVFALNLKTKNFHWHMRGRHFRDCRVMLAASAVRGVDQGVQVTSPRRTST